MPVGAFRIPPPIFIHKHTHTHTHTSKSLQGLSWKRFRWEGVCSSSLPSVYKPHIHVYTHTHTHQVALQQTPSHLYTYHTDTHRHMETHTNSHTNSHTHTQLELRGAVIPFSTLSDCMSAVLTHLALTLSVTHSLSLCHLSISPSLPFFRELQRALQRAAAWEDRGKNFVQS